MALAVYNRRLEERIPSYEGLELTDKDAVVDRPKWGSKLEYILSCVGFCIGLGNVWRFPYLCQSHGGGAFLIPYLILLVLEGMPLLMMEFAIGQRLRKGSVGVWRAIHPYLTGIGVASMLVSFLVALYYTTLVAWIMLYLFNSFSDPLPWSQCPIIPNRTEYVPECQQSSTVEYYFYRHTLDISASIGESGDIHWPVVLSLLCAWSVIAVCCMRGVSSTGKAVYVTALLPYFVLFVFLIRGMMLKGALSGVQFLFTPDVNELLNPKTWLDAGAQVFYALGLAWGGLIAFSSYNPVHNNCVKDAVILSGVTGFTSVFAATVTYSIIGFMATAKFDTCMAENIIVLQNAFNYAEGHITESNFETIYNQLNASSPDVVLGLNIKTCDMQTFLSEGVEGIGLAFIVFTQAITKMPGSAFWSVLFFVMLLCLGLSTLFGNIEGVVAPLRDLNVFPKHWPREVLTGLTCLAGFFLSLPFALNSGLYWVTLFDNFAGSVPLLTVGLFEMLAVVHVYGMKRFNKDMRFMVRKSPSIFWQMTLRVVSPLIILVILAFYLVTQAQEELSYSVWDTNSEDFPTLASVLYPDWVKGVIFLLAGIPSMMMPLYAFGRFIFVYFKKRQSNRSTV